jgi:hypothetical protein
MNALEEIQQCTLNVRQREKQMQDQSKRVRAELDELKARLLTAMQAQDLAFLPLGDKLFAVRKVKTNRPQINAELVTVALRIHARNNSVQLTDAVVEGFWALVTECQQKMGVGQEVLEFQETLPVQSLY